MRKSMILAVTLLWLSDMSSRGSAQEASGVGMALGQEGDDIVVNALLPDAPAAASHAIHVGDRIIAVAQENGTDVPVKGLKLTDIVSQIRGPKGTTVRLTIVPAKKDDTQAYVLSLVRGELKELAQWGDGALLKSGTKAPNIRFVPLDGRPPEHLADYAGKILVLEFWSISCGPCQGKMADLQSYAGKHPEWEGKVVLMGLNCVDDNLDLVISHVKLKGWNKTHNVRVGADAMKAYHVNALPTVYVIDQRGSVVDSSHGLDIPATVNRLVHGE